MVIIFTTPRDQREEGLSRIRSLKKTAMTTGVICLLVSIIGSIISSNESFFPHYLFGYLFWLQLGLGSMALLMISFLTGGEWGKKTKPILEAANRTQLALAILFLPILIGIKKIYPWTDNALLMSDETIKHKALYLNIPFFCLRAVLYFAFWIFASRKIDDWSQQTAVDPGAGAKLKSLSAGGLVLYAFSVSFASIDWQMSLEPRWYSTIYGMVFGVSHLLAAWAFTIASLVWMASKVVSSRDLSANILKDLGNLLLTFIMTWAYLSFMQYLIIWSANVPEEARWAYRRINNGWQWLALLVVVFQLAAPFLLLLFRPVKTRPAALAGIAVLVVLFNVFDRYWQTMPALYENFRFDWLAIINFFGIGGLWVAVFLGNLLRRPVHA